MDLFNLFAFLTTLAAAFGWFNHRYLRLPTTVGLMVLALGFSLALIVVGRVADAPQIDALVQALEAVDFDKTLLHGMLGALLFAGALHVDLNDLARQWRTIGMLATIGVLFSTALVGLASFLVFQCLSLDVPFTQCLLFGALISPTDPVAVLGAIRGLAVPKSLAVKITGESLFNDGIAVVVFLTLLELATGNGHTGGREVLQLLGIQVLGGILFGFVVGWLAYRMICSVDNYQIEILITLAIVTGGYALAQVINVSGPLAMVVAGLLIGNQGRSFGMSGRTRERLDGFWELVDEFMNALLFLLIGLELLVLTLRGTYLAAGALCVVIVLVARWLSVGGAIIVMRTVRTFSAHAIKILTWSGLRGGISVALALSLPAGPERDLFVTATYVVVAFSIIGQGLTLRPFVKRLYGSTD